MTPRELSIKTRCLFFLAPLDGSLLEEVLDSVLYTAAIASRGGNSGRWIAEWCLSKKALFAKWAHLKLVSSAKCGDLG